MKGFLKFFALVLLLVPAWIVFLTMTGGDRAEQRPSVGPLVALAQALQDEKADLRLSGVTGMAPIAPANAWRLEGLVAGPEGSAESMARPFVAAMHTTCLPHWEATCWAVDRLDFTAVGDTPPQTADPQTYPQDDTGSERLSIVQDQLRDLGYDPGSSDGVMGLRTQQAVAAYIGQSGDGAATPTAEALVQLEVMGRLARAARRHAAGDYHGAVADYAKVVELDPTNVRSHFNRGLIFRDMGLAGLAIENFDGALALRGDHAMAYHSRGNAHFDRGDYWRAFADHADGLGVRYLGERYLALKADLGEVRSQLAPGFAAMRDWAEGAWDQARRRLAEKLQRSNGASADHAT